MYIERDWRRQTPAGRSDGGGNADYLTRCMELLIGAITQLLPEITSLYQITFLQINLLSVHYNVYFFDKSNLTSYYLLVDIYHWAPLHFCLS